MKEKEFADQCFSNKLPGLLNLKYHAILDEGRTLGGVDRIRATFFNFQKELYGVA